MKTHLILCFTFMLLMGLTACGGNEHSEYSKGDYYYGIILSTQQGEFSVLKLFNSDGHPVGQKKIYAFGIDDNGGAFLSGPLFRNGHWFFGCDSTAILQDFILQINNENLEINRIKTNTKLSCTSFTVDGESLFASYASPNGTFISKSSILDGTLQAKTTISGIGMHKLIYDNVLIVIGNTTTLSGTENIWIRLFKKDTLNQVAELEIKDRYFPIDAQVYKDMLYIVPLLNERLSHKVNEFITYNLKENIISKHTIPFQDANKIHVTDDYIYIVQKSHNFDKTNNSIARLNVKTNELNISNFEHIHQQTIISKGRLISTDGRKVFIYDLNDFRIMNEFEINVENNLMFGSLFVKK